jgi:methylmalonyl-CoA mutase cobalamin-binding domain/chain
METTRKIRVLLSKTGLDGHDRGIKVVAMALKNAGIEVIYAGRHQTPEQVVNAALQEDVDFLGVSNLSGSYKELLTRIIGILKEKNVHDIKILLGGTIADEDVPELEKMNIKVFPSGTNLQEIINYTTKNA